MNLLDQLARTTGANLSPGTEPPGPAGDSPVCSRKGCRQPAAWRLLWNNPRIHTPERRKTWLACGDHRGWLEEYLQTRDLWKETLPLAEAPASPNTTAGSA
ncbi:hypothetical protein OL239_09685 [Arthrobacter sp. ATA002]|uniref:hypothetical protein n=1 Tax=Arthrobacter sp. ATA002 TaxID=2991715 RepID=UPI0022A69F23|nr:hypothetical protein [Arthrobacter sp. ATA002]WAP50371.1 hypothetical protein OL239_09685 [Arthrobacter sp. ATA002]